jgi:ATP synthase protein I
VTLKLERGVRQVLLLQLLATALIALPLLPLRGAQAAVSAALGGGIGFTSSLAYALCMSAPGSTEPRDLLKAHVRAEALKLLTTVGLLAAVLIFLKEISPLPLMLTFIATLAAYWIALLVAK